MIQMDDYSYDKQVDGKMDEQTDGQKYGWIDVWIEWVSSSFEKWVDGKMDGS